MIVMDVATPLLSITVMDELGTEQTVEHWHGGYMSLFEYLFGGDVKQDSRYLACVDTSGQDTKQLIPEPNASLRRVWTEDKTLATNIDADGRMLVLRQEEVERVGQIPTGWD